MSKKEPSEPVYRVVFQQQGEVYEIYARYLYPSELYGFIEVEEMLFGERSQVVVDPAEEKLKSLFADVKRSFIPMHNILRIDEVSKEGSPTVSRGDSSSTNVRFLPGHGFPGGPGGAG